MSQVYERELKGILMADREVLARVTKNLPHNEAVRYLRILEKPYVVVRAAGSFGIDMAVIGSMSFLVEEKTSVESTYHFNSERVIEQATNLKKISSSAGVPPLYAYRLKNMRGKDPWRIFTIDLPPNTLEGYHHYIHEKLIQKGARLEKTKNDNYIMYWENGTPLNEFIDWTTTLRSRPPLEENKCPTS